MLEKQNTRCFIENYDAECMANAMHETSECVVNPARKAAQQSVSHD